MAMRTDLATTLGRLVVAATADLADEHLPVVAGVIDLAADLADALVQPADAERLADLRRAAEVAAAMHRPARRPE